jgi:hypothetical protein
VERTWEHLLEEILLIATAAILSGYSAFAICFEESGIMLEPVTRTTPFPQKRETT